MAMYMHILTLISLINVEPTLTDFEKFHPPQNKNPPSTFIDFLDFSTLHSSFIRFMYKFFPKNPTLHVYSNLHVDWFFSFCTPSTFKSPSTVIREMKVSD